MPRGFYTNISVHCTAVFHHWSFILNRFSTIGANMVIFNRHKTILQNEQINNNDCNDDNNADSSFSFENSKFFHFCSFLSAPLGKPIVSWLTSIVKHYSEKYLECVETLIQGLRHLSNLAKFQRMH